MDDIEDSFASRVKDPKATASASDVNIKEMVDAAGQEPKNKMSNNQLCSQEKQQEENKQNL